MGTGGISLDTPRGRVGSHESGPAYGAWPPIQERCDCRTASPLSRVLCTLVRCRLSSTTETSSSMILQKDLLPQDPQSRPAGHPPTELSAPRPADVNRLPVLRDGGQSAQLSCDRWHWSWDGFTLHVRSDYFLPFTGRTWPSTHPEQCRTMHQVVARHVETHFCDGLAGRPLHKHPQRVRTVDYRRSAVYPTNGYHSHRVLNVRF